MIAQTPSRIGKPGGPRSAARLAAVQALYQLDSTGEPVSLVIEEFVRHRLGETIDGVEFIKGDEALFTDVAGQAWQQRAVVDQAFAAHLPPGWPLQRLERLVRAVLRCATYELKARIDVPTAVILNEYLDVAHAFFAQAEVRFINGVLDAVAKKLREAG